MNRGLAALAVLGLLALAAFFRLYLLPEIPPGLHHDEAFNGLDALKVLQGQWPIFFSANNGREPLFIYLQAIAVYLFGPDRLALRLVAALVGITTVLMTYIFAKRLYGPWAGLLSGALLAVSFWHVDLSRIGFRAILVSLFGLLILLFLWKALAQRRMTYFGLGGFFLGLSFYTYLSARLFPLVVLLILVWQWALDRDFLRRYWSGLVIFGAIAFLTAAPLGYYFWQHPEDFFGRIGQVAIVSEQQPMASPATSLLESAWRTTGMFFVDGDHNWRHNLAGRPVFDPFTAIFFVLGVIWTLARLATPATDSDHGPKLYPQAWFMIWFVIMLLPSALSRESPHFLRSLGAVPPTYVFAALGLINATRFIARKVPTGAGASALALPLLAILWSGYLTYRDYFQDWAGRVETYYAHDGNLYDLAQSLNQRKGDEALFISSYLFIDASPTIAFLSPSYLNARWFDEDSTALPISSDSDRGALYIFSPKAALIERFESYLPGASLLEKKLDTAGRPAFLAYYASAEALKSAIGPSTSLQTTFGDGTTLMGYSTASGRTEAGAVSEVSLLWRIEKPTQDRYSLFLHLLDSRGRLWAQDDLRIGMVLGWLKDDYFISRHRISIPADAPPVNYRLWTGIVSEASQARLPPQSSQERDGALPLMAVGVSEPASRPTESPKPQVAVGQEIAEGIELLGYDLGSPSIKPGQGVDIVLLWFPRRELKRDLSIRLRLVSDQGQVLSEAIDKPMYGEYPTVDWKPGYPWGDPHRLTIPASAPAGSHRLMVALIDEKTGEVLGEVGGGYIQVEERKREFSLPPIQHPLEVNFDNQVVLRGYDLEPPIVSRFGIVSGEPSPVKPGGGITIILYWQALVAPRANYTVFTHLLDQANKVVAQQDSQPQRGDYPTLGWLAGEVVRDEYVLSLPPTLAPGEYVTEVGLYDASTGKRLPIVTPSGPQGDRVLLEPVQVVR